VTATGERVSTPAGGFNPTWQRHMAAYRLCAPLLPDGRVLDLGCGVGHSFSELAPRESVGLDLDADALRGQQRETVVGDMREIPFGDGSFASVLSVQSIEHVPDHRHVLEEVRRVLEPGGGAIFVTPNRLTFARPDEIIDPYHYAEYDRGELRAACEPYFESVEMHGLFGSTRYLELVDAERVKLDALLRKDPLRLRRFVPRTALQRLYDRRLTRERENPHPGAAAITVDDFELRAEGLEQALDVVAVCRSPRAAPRTQARSG
jgi:SAM-dependent methyltransferase